MSQTTNVNSEFRTLKDSSIQLRKYNNVLYNRCDDSGQRG